MLAPYRPIRNDSCKCLHVAITYALATVMFYSASVRMLRYWINTLPVDILGLQYIAETVVGCVEQWLDRWSLTGELSLSHARPAADG